MEYIKHTHIDLMCHIPVYYIDKNINLFLPEAKVTGSNPVWRAINLSQPVECIDCMARGACAACAACLHIP